MTSWTLRDIPDQSGKLAVVTGATGGLGLETAMALAGAGAEVILAGRNPGKGRAAEAQIRARHPQANIRFETIDLASLAAVAAFSDAMLAAARPIDILVNNAGIMALPKRMLTPDGFEMQVGTNYLSHFALTGRLLPLLRAGQARVVQLSSIAHRRGTIRLDNLNAERGYKPFQVYAQTKLAMLMFAFELDRRSKAHGWGLTSVAAHPGVATTDIIANGMAPNPLVAWLSRTVIGVIGHSAADGALPQINAATAPNLAGGEYIGPQGWMEMRGPPGLAKAEPQALDRDVASKLWSASEDLTGVVYR
ncbi:SDR family oxidoreductase [Novosphingobium sp.]|uniref:SDR family oxidoreductase n=1 Tax=Novosphingobium sp. TaxID=1874826 RepID=UPI003B52EEB3